MTSFRVMGVVNVTPDSFSDGGLYLDTGAAVAHGLEMEREGAAILDIGGESTRPGAECCLMHMLGEPRTMQVDPHYDDVVSDVKAFLEARMNVATASGIDERRILLDPGIGFGKTVEHNLELLRRLDELVALGRPVVIGTSRKSFLGRLTGQADAQRRLPGTIATNVLAFERGARVFRVHDVAPVVDALTVTAATVTQPWISTTATSSTK